MRVVGIEPTVSAWKANRLPLTDTRLMYPRGELNPRFHRERVLS